MSSGPSSPARHRGRRANPAHHAGGTGSGESEASCAAGHQAGGIGRTGVASPTAADTIGGVSVTRPPPNPPGHRTPPAGIPASWVRPSLARVAHTPFLVVPLDLPRVP